MFILVLSKTVILHGEITKVVGPFATHTESVRWHIENNEELDRLGVATITCESLQKPLWKEESE